MNRIPLTLVFVSLLILRVSAGERSETELFIEPEIGIQTGVSAGRSDSVLAVMIPPRPQGNSVLP